MEIGRTWASVALVGNSLADGGENGDRLAPRFPVAYAVVVTYWLMPRRGVVLGLRDAHFRPAAGPVARNRDAAARLRRGKCSLKWPKALSLLWFSPLLRRKHVQQHGEPLAKSRTGLERLLATRRTSCALRAARADSLQGYKSFAIDIALYVLGIAAIALLRRPGGEDCRRSRRPARRWSISARCRTRAAHRLRWSGRGWATR